MVEEQFDILRGKRSEYSPPTDPYWNQQWTLVSIDIQLLLCV